MSEVLERWNGLGMEAAEAEVFPCCGSAGWARGMAARRPLRQAAEVIAASEAVCAGMTREDWMEAFGSHPRIGERKAQGAVTAASLQWSGEEQGRAMSADERAKAALVEGNAGYEARFGRIFIVCARGRSAGEVLVELERRMGNEEAAEMRESAEEQRKITELRLRRWMEAV